MAPKLGILAGAGELPKRAIAACRAAGRPYFVIAFEGSADPAIVNGAPHAWIRLGAAGEGLRILRETPLGAPAPPRLAHRQVLRPHRLSRARR
jgi:UDP-2,3-diacylglucosamine hydrolase